MRHVVARRMRADMSYACTGPRGVNLASSPSLRPQTRHLALLVTIHSAVTPVVMQVECPGIENWVLIRRGRDNREWCFASREMQLQQVLLHLRAECIDHDVRTTTRSITCCQRTRRLYDSHRHPTWIASSINLR